MKTSYQQIRDKQRRWAAQRNIRIDDDGYTVTLDDNLYLPMSSAARSDYAAGSGDELGIGGNRGKMQALHSSSALVCNVFDFWRDRPMHAVAKVCAAPENISELHFEQRYPTGLKGTPPNLDVILHGSGAKPFAIESKFTEPYQAHSVNVAFQNSYFTTQPGLWAQYELPRCEELARSIHEGRTVFRRLGGAQLLKHILGLFKAYGSNFTLLYLWYEFPSDEAKVHRAELESFQQQLDSSLDFRAMTYADVFDRLRESPDVDGEYIFYLEQRYFGA